MKRMKRLDSYRLFDLLLMVLLTGLTVILIFMISLGYNQISKYFEEIEDFPYFIAFLPAFLSSLIHSLINYFASRRHGHNLIDLADAPSQKQGLIGLYVALTGTVISVIFVILFLTGTIEGEEYLYVLVSLPAGLAPFAYFLFNECYNLAMANMKPRKKAIEFASIALLVLPLIVALATYFPGVLGYTYLGFAFLPLAYAIGDAVCLPKDYADLVNDDDL